MLLISPRLSQLPQLISMIGFNSRRPARRISAGRVLDSSQFVNAFPSVRNPAVEDTRMPGMAQPAIWLRRRPFPISDRKGSEHKAWLPFVNGNGILHWYENHDGAH
jgi:hypothetical protein